MNLLKHQESKHFNCEKNLTAKDSESMGGIKKKIRSCVNRFSKNILLKEILLATGNAFLIEHNEAVGRDDYWSDTGNGIGKNMLGKILMEVRGKLSGTNSFTSQREATYRSDLKKIWCGGEFLFFR